MEGDVIKKINNISINTQAEAQKALENVGKAEKLTIELIRDHKKKVLNYSVDKKEGHP
jgi:S1-C subfamily serine protease